MSLSVFCFEFFSYHWLNKQLLFPNNLYAFLDQVFQTFGGFPSLPWYEHSNEIFLALYFPAGSLQAPREAGLPHEIF